MFKHNFLKFLRPNMDRIKQVGPDRACAEWLLRCGAKVKWQNNKTWLVDYNHLLSTSNKNKISEIEAIDSSIMDIGFIHLQGCNYIKRFFMDSCPYVEDNALQKLESIKYSLENLELRNLLGVTDEGVKRLKELKKLKKLSLSDLPSVRYKSTFDILQEALPSCEITQKNINLY